VGVNTKNLILIASGGHYGLHIFFTKDVYTHRINKKEYIKVQFTSSVEKQ